MSSSADGSIKGKASWYCKAGVSVCHYKYGPSTMSAAACGKLRRAMGGRDKDWRGKTVSVMNNQTGVIISVRLVDWCGSEDKTIDLYWIAMCGLQSCDPGKDTVRGVVQVTVRW